MEKTPLTAVALRSAFTWALFTGMGCLMAGMFLNINTMLVILLPVAIMVSYIAWYQTRQSTPSHIDQFADSLYYLGFLFTIGSLVFSLAPWALGTSKLAAEDVLARFGVALLTTMLGLGARVFYTQFRITVEQASLDAHHSLTNATQRFTTELKLATDGIKAMRKELLAEIEAIKISTKADIEASAQAAAEEIRASVRTASEGITEHVKITSAGISGHLALITQALDSHLKTAATETSTHLKTAILGVEKLVSTTLRRTASIVDQFERKVIAIDIPPDLFQQAATKPFMEVSNELAQLSAEVKSSSGEWHKLNTHWTKVNKQLGKTLDELERIGGIALSISQTTESIRLTNEQLAAMPAGITQVSDAAKIAVSDLGTTSSEAARKASEDIALIPADISRIAEAASLAAHVCQDSAVGAIEKTVESLSAASMEITHAVQTAVETLNNTASEAKTLREQLQAEYKEVVDLRNTLFTEVEAAVDATRQMHQSIVDGGRFIIKQFNGHGERLT